MLELNTIHNMDCLDGIKLLDDNSIDCCITSPPYWGLRDYGNDAQIGLEESPEEYVQKLVAVLHEVKRALKQDGTLWLNLGDSYADGGRGNGNTGTEKQSTNKGSLGFPAKKRPDGIKHKDLVGIPWMVAFALRADGWYLRQDIIWAKPNPMPESVTDRCTKSHEYIFLMSKSPQYYFNAEAISEPVALSTISRLSQNVESQIGSDRTPGKTNGNMKASAPRYGGNKYTSNPDVFNRTKSGGLYSIPEDARRNKRSVWIVSKQPFKQAHFATFPEDLIVPCVLSGCKEGGIILDPFMGAGTTALVAVKHNRQFIGFELNPEYIEIANRRIEMDKRQLNLF